MIGSPETFPAHPGGGDCLWCHYSLSDRPAFDCRNPTHVGDRSLVIPKAAKLKPGDLIRVIEGGWELVEPDAGDVEALREVLCFCDDVHDCQTTEDSDRLKAACERNVQRVAARLDAVRRKAASDALTEAADRWPEDGMTRAEAQQWLAGRAAYIARESR